MLWLAVAGVLPAHADEPVLQVSGRVERPLSLSRAELRALPRQTVRATEHSGAVAVFEGVALTELLQRAGAPVREQLRGRAVRLGVLAHARDGYRALFALAEVDADFGGRSVLVADRRDGEDLDADTGPFRLIVPDDRRHARWIRQVTTLEVVDGWDASDLDAAPAAPPVPAEAKPTESPPAGPVAVSAQAAPALAPQKPKPAHAER